MPEYRDYAATATSFSGLAAYQDVALALGSGGEPERVRGMLVSGNYFRVLGLVPAAGRFFVPEEDRDPSAHPVVVLSHGLWRRRFGSDPGIVGTDITVNGRRFMVVGVAPAGFGTALRSQSSKKSLSAESLNLRRARKAHPNVYAQHLRLTGSKLPHEMSYPTTIRLQYGVTPAQESQ